MTDDEAVRFAVASLLDVIENGAKNLEVEPMPGGQAMRLMAKEDVPRVIDSLHEK
jgi:20S proteasome alpha/beta subunit